MNKYEICRIILCGLICVCFSGCSSRHENLHDGILIDGYDTKSTSADFVDKTELIELELTPQSMLFNIQKVELTDSLIILQDERCGVVCFDRNGKFRNTISGKGRAANEYMRLNTFALDGDKVLIFDGALNKIMTFQLDGKFIDSSRCNPDILGNTHRVELLADGSILLNNLLFGEDNDIYTLLNASGEKQKVLSTPLHSHSSGNYIGTHPMARSKNGILMIRPFDNIIYRLTDSNHLETAYIIETQNKVADDGILADKNEFSIMTYMDLMDYFQGFTSIFDMENCVILSFFSNDYFYIDKSANSIACISADDEDGEIIRLPFFNIVSNTSNQLIGVVAPYKLHDYIEEAESVATDLRSEIENIPMDGNPVLIVYNLK